MDDGLRAGLLLFALLLSLSAVPVLMRRMRPVVVVAHHGVGLCVALALVVAGALGGGDARPLLLPYLVGTALLAVGGPAPGGRAVVPRWLRATGIGLAVVGVGLAGAAALGLVFPLVARLLVALLVVAFGSAAALRSARAAQRQESPFARGAEVAAAASSVLASAAVALAFVDDSAALVWPAALGASAGLLTSARVPPFQTLTARDGVSAFFVGLAVFFALTLERSAFESALAGGAVMWLVVGVLAATKPLLATRRAPAPSPLAFAAKGSAEPAPSLADAALAHMAPMLDDALLFRPGRPRLNARVTAKRLLEAALDKAKGAHPHSRRSTLQVEVREDDADVDIEGDAAELAEALCAVLDNALCLKEQHPSLYVRVHLRGSPGHVTFEVSDDLAEHAPDDVGQGPVADQPFAAARDHGPRPGLGIGLARAKLLVERHGGVLLVRRTPEGSCVQMTVPRRRSRHPLGVA